MVRPQDQPPSVGRSAEFTAHAASVPQARRFALTAVKDLHREDLLDDVAIAVTELCTNSLLHADTPFTLTVSSTETGVRVEVSDHDPRPPVSPTGFASSTGRGLTLLKARGEVR